MGQTKAHKQLFDSAQSCDLLRPVQNTKPLRCPKYTPKYTRNPFPKPKYEKNTKNIRKSGFSYFFVFFSDFGFRRGFRVYSGHRRSQAQSLDTPAEMLAFSVFFSPNPPHQVHQLGWMLLALTSSATSLLRQCRPHSQRNLSNGQLTSPG